MRMLAASSSPTLGTAGAHQLQPGAGMSLKAHEQPGGGMPLEAHEQPGGGMSLKAHEQPGAGEPLKDIIALVGCIPDAELNMPATAQRLRSWCLSFGGGGGAGGMTWLSAELALHVSGYLLAHPSGGTGGTGGAGGSGAVGGEEGGGSALKGCRPDDRDVDLICSKARVLARWVPSCKLAPRVLPVLRLRILGSKLLKGGAASLRALAVVLLAQRPAELSHEN